MRAHFLSPTVALSLSLALPLASLSTLRAADWPTFRGADRQDISHETGLLKEWPANGPEKVWMNEDVGLGYSGYAIANGTVYTLGARDVVEYVIAVDAATGKEKWAAECGAVLTNGWGDGPRSTPTVDGDHVYAMGGKGTLICLTQNEGKEVWRVTMESLGGKVPGWGFCESPLVEGNLVIVTPGGAQGTLAAFDKLTGKPAWRSGDWTDPAQYASIVPVDYNGSRQLIQLTMQSVAAVNAADGKLLWKSEFPGKTAVIPTPIFHQGQVFATAGYGVGCKSFKVGPDNAVEELYQNTEMGNHHGGVVLVNGHLYGYAEKNGWTCMDFKTGEVKWVEKRALGKGAIHAADGMLYLLEEKTGTVVLITASSESWQEHGRFTLQPQTTQRHPKGMIWTHPVVSNGRLYLRDQELLFSFDVSGK